VTDVDGETSGMLSRKVEVEKEGTKNDICGTYDDRRKAKAPVSHPKMAPSPPNGKFSIGNNQTFTLLT